MKINNKKYSDFEALSPYKSKVDPKEDRVVRRVEVFANILSRLLFILKAPFSLLKKGASKILRRERFYYENLPQEKINPKKLEPPKIKEVYLPSDTACMNQDFYFSLSDGVLWFKPIAMGKKGEWRLFGEGGIPKGAKVPLTKISADGENIVVVDSRDDLFYGHAKEVQMIVNDSKEGWKVTKLRTDWQRKWFAMSFIHHLVNRLKDPILHTKPFKKICISQKGPETGYYTDVAGKKHPEFLVGVTTLYALNQEGNRIFFADPWLGNGFKNEITGPEEGRFCAENMAAAGSTVFLMARGRDKNGREVQKMYTRFADFDSIGSNPILPKTFNNNNKIPLIRYCPSEDWLKQPSIPLKGKASLTGKIGVLQTGRGQSHRQLRVEGTDSKGNTGFYFKYIYEEKWAFEKTGEIFHKKSFLPGTHKEIKKGKKITSDYVGSMSSHLSFSLKNVEVKRFMKQGFNERGLHTKVIFKTASGKNFEFRLFAFRGAKHLLGLSQNAPYWKLIIPESYKKSQDPELQEILKKLFNNKSALSVKVDEKEEGVLKITPTFLSRNSFKISVKKS